MMFGVVAAGQIGGGSPECINSPATPSECEQPYTPTHADPALKPASQIALVSTQEEARICANTASVNSTSPNSGCPMCHDVGEPVA